jgi:uncharacterized protein (DUF488 family)
MAEFIAALKGAGVERVIDVRAVPLSRRPGFSKNILAASLREAGIEYVHLKNLGTPKPGAMRPRRATSRRWRRCTKPSSNCPKHKPRRRRCARWRGETSALLCFERNPAHCHRTLLLAAEGQGMEVVDLIP